MTRPTTRSLRWNAWPLPLLLVAGAVHADVPRFEITPFAGGRMGGGFDATDDAGVTTEADLESGASFGVDLGLYRDSSSFYELLYDHQQTAFDSSDAALEGVDVNVDYLHVGGTVLFPDEYWFVPYVSLTIGAAMFSPDGPYDSETKFSASLGGGVRLPISDSVAVTLGLRGYLTFVSSDTDLFCASGPEGGACLVHSTGSTLFQGEGLLGVTVRF
jgi:Outer membrane protein beta-barrel domain